MLPTTKEAKALQKILKARSAEETNLTAQEITTRHGVTAQVMRNTSGQFAEKPKRYSYVYLMGNDEHNWQKIGMTDNPARRVKDLTVPFELHLIACIPVARSRKIAHAVEKQVHRAFSSKRLTGEWFSSVTAEDFIGAIENIVEKGVVYTTAKPCMLCGH